MPRPTGRRNLDFEAKRVDLARRAQKAMVSLETGASLREIAEHAGTSLTNLRHYFGDRDGLYAAVAEVGNQDAAPWLGLVANLDGDDAQGVLNRYFELLLIGWRQFGVGRIFELGLTEGMGNPARGPATVNHVLEPTLGALEALLTKLVAQDLLPPMEIRGAALALVSPVMVALLHQDGLFGNECRPLDVGAFARAHVERWLSGYAAR